MKEAQRQGYVSLTCRDYVERRHALDAGTKYLVLRIDVDRSPAKTRRMAAMFADAGMAATFFFRLHSPFYNLLSYPAMEVLCELDRMGFELGLHCEPLDVALVRNEDPVQSLRRDIEMFRVLLGHDFPGAASHRERVGLNNLEFWKDHKPAEFDLAYEAYDDDSFGLFQVGTYVSDSELTRWKVFKQGELVEGDDRSLREHLSNGNRLVYALLHPFLFRDRHAFEE